MNHLPCPSCQRHVRPTESVCPFCANALERAPEPTLPVSPLAVPGPAARLGRIAVLAAGAALMSGVASCDDNAVPTTGTGGAAATGGKGGGAGTSGSGGAGGGAGAGGAASGSGGAAAKDAGTDTPIAIYAAAVALPSNQA